MKLAIVSLLAALLVACSSGGNGERILHLGSGDFSEAQFRTQVRAALFESTDTERFCHSLADLSDAEVSALIVELQRDKATPVQVADAAHRERAAAIVREECGRLFP